MHMYVLVSTSYYTCKEKNEKRCVLFAFLLFWDATMIVSFSIPKSGFTEQPLKCIPQQCWRGRLKLQWRKGFNCKFLLSVFPSIPDSYILPNWWFFCRRTVALQVLFHLLRAGYFLHKKEQCHSNGVLAEHEVAFPIRTIYFESPSAFPEINSFTYEIASMWENLLSWFRYNFFFN